MVKEFTRKAVVLTQLLLCLLLVAGIVFYLEKSDTTPSDTTIGNRDTNNLSTGDPLPDSALTQNISSAATASPEHILSAFSVQTGRTDTYVNRIRLWQDPTDEGLYLFLPSHTDTTGISLSFGSLANGRIDGTLYQNGATLSLDTGIHTLSDASETESYSFQVLKSSGVQTLYTGTASGSLDYLLSSKEHFEAGNAMIIDVSGNTVYQGKMAELSGHGNSSWFSTEKRSFQIKFPEQVDLFHMGAARNWILVSNAFDPSLLRNYITYDLADKIGLAYSPEGVFVDWYADGEYQGNYLLCEKIEIGKNRVAISDLESDTESVNESEELSLFAQKSVGEENARGSYKGFALKNPSDISGGYLLSLELNTEYEPRYANELSGFVTYRNQAVVLKRPVCASMEQVAYIRDLYQAAEDAFMDESGFNPETGFYYTHYIDVGSFARKYIMEEFTKNMDAQYSSQFFYKPADSVSKRLFAGPVWDYDRAWGCSGSRIGVDLEDPETFYVNQYTYEGTPWYGLYQQESFRDYVKRTFRLSVLPALEETLYENIDACAAELSDSALMNDYRWHVTEASSEDAKRKSYQEAVASMKDFGIRRMEFLKSQWLSSDLSE